MVNVQGSVARQPALKGQYTNARSSLPSVSDISTLGFICLDPELLLTRFGRGGPSNMFAAANSSSDSNGVFKLAASFSFSSHFRLASATT